MLKHYIRPEDLSADETQKVLQFLNSAQTAEEIADTVEFPGELNVGIRVGQRILDKRTDLGGQFSNLKQVADIPYVGPERFTEIVSSLTGRPIARFGEDTLSASQVLNELRELREMVKALQAGLGIRYQVTLRATKRHLYVGQPVTLIIKVIDTRYGKPKPNVCLTLAANWGILQTSLGFEQQRGSVVRTYTDINGLAEIDLISPTMEQLSSTQQYALETALRVLDPEAETPAEAASGLEAMVNRYRLESDTDLRSAIDIYFRARTDSIADAINPSINWGAWSYCESLVMAYIHDVADESGGATASVHSMAALNVRFKDWLEPWYHTYSKILEGTSNLSDDIDTVCESVTDKADLLDGILGNVYAYIGVQQGRVGESIGQKIAQISLNHFLATGFDTLPLDSRQSLYHALSIASKHIDTSNMGTLAVASQVRVDMKKEVGLNLSELNTTLTDRVKGVKDQVGNLETQLSTKVDVNNFDVALRDKVNTAAFESFQAQVNQSLEYKVDTDNFNIFKTEVNTALGKMVDITSFNEFSNNVDANISELTNKVGGLELQLIGKIDRAEFNNELSSKLDSVAFDGFKAQVNESLKNKVERGTFDQFKSNVSNNIGAVTDKVGNLEGQIKGKVDSSELNKAMAGKVDTATFEGFQTQVRKLVNSKVDTASFKQFETDTNKALENKLGAEKFTQFQTQVTNSLKSKVNSATFNQLSKDVKTNFESVRTRITKLERG
jgi:hypothetical protein